LDEWVEDMKMTKLVPYLMFTGNCREAIEFYQSIFGGTLAMQTYAEAPGDVSEEYQDRILHVQLESDDFSLMASDTHPQFSPPSVIGNNITLTIVGNDTKKLTDYFNKLAVGGKIDMKLEKQFWGDVCGGLTDKFGIPWMIDIGE